MPPDVPKDGFLVQNKVGRLIEARVFGLRTRDDADRYTRELGLVRMALPASVRPILCADHRPVVVYAEPAADRLVELFKQMNQRLERVAIVVARSNATLAMQLNRFVREASNAARRVVHDAADAEVHLGSVLTAEERTRLRDFLAEFTPPAVRRDPP
jgi:predicted trehalose synthase